MMLRAENIHVRYGEREVLSGAALGVEEGFMGLGANKVRFLGHGIGLVQGGVQKTLAQIHGMQQEIVFFVTDQRPQGAQ